MLPPLPIYQLYSWLRHIHPRNKPGILLQLRYTQFYRTFITSAAWIHYMATDVARAVSLLLHADVRKCIVVFALLPFHGFCSLLRLINTLTSEHNVDGLSGYKLNFSCGITSVAATNSMSGFSTCGVPSF